MKIVRAMAEETGNKLTIRIHVYDQDFSVNIPREDEELYRKGAKLITDVVNNYATHFVGTKSLKDILYMALIDIALRYEKEAKRNDVTPFNNILSQLTSEIEEAMNVK